MSNPHPLWRQNACEWCKAGAPLSGARHDTSRWTYQDCTAPTETEFVEILLARVAELEAKVADQDEELRNHSVAWRTRKAELKTAMARIAELEQNKADLEALQASNLDRFFWLFGSPDEGASRDDIERILTHTGSLEEALAMIDDAMNQTAREQKR